MTPITYDEAPFRADRRLMVLRAFLCFNVVVGTIFGGFGITVPFLRERFHVDLGIVSLGLALVVLSIGVLMPIVAASVERFGLRFTMMVGVSLGAAGNVLLAVAPSVTVFLLAFGLLLGPAGAFAGTIPTSLLAGGWFPHARGRAVGLTMMPVLIAATPTVGFLVIERFGLSTFYILLAVIHLLTLLVLAGVREPPAIVNEGHVESAQSGMPALLLLRRPLFWGLVLGGGLLYATGAADATHMVSVLIERGISRGEAAILVSIMGGAAVFGSLGIGYLADRIGGSGALAFVGLGFAGSWAVIGLTGWLPVMVPAMLIAGSCSAGVFASLNVAMAHFFGAATLGRATAYIALCTLPMTVLLPPGAGLLHDITGSYQMVIAVIASGTGLVGILFLALRRHEGRGVGPDRSGLSK